MASSTTAAAAWSITACLRYRGGLEIHAAAENVFPGWGRGGERLSFLLRLRRRFRIAVTSQCGRALAPTENGKTRALAPAEGAYKPRGFKLVRFLRSRCARVPRVLSVWRRKKPRRGAAAATAEPNARAQAIPSLSNRARMLLLLPPSTKTALCVIVALAVAAASVAVLRLMAGLMMTTSASCTSWRCFLAKKLVRFLGPPLYEALWTTSLKFVKFLEPSLHCEWLPKLINLKWLWT